MSIGFIFWLLMILALLFGGWRTWSADPNGRYYFGFGFLLWILLFLLGWRVFGFVIQG